MKSYENQMGVTVVIPCLNEQGTLPLVLAKLNDLRGKIKRELEVIVSDNGSTDRSAAVATEMGARVVACPTRGYGAALKQGIRSATHEYVLFADADNTYDFMQVPSLVAKLDEGFEFVIGSRMGGDIKLGAMPFLHRYLGTPVLNALINVLYAPKGFRVEDCNSGFRGFRKSVFLRWNVEGDGMEFASEMLIKAMLDNVRMVHVPISLSPDVRGRVPHLKTWRDGTRHLLQVLLYSSKAFHIPGVFSFSLGWVLMLSCLIWGPVRIGQASILEIHTMMFGLLAVVFGQSVWGIGLFVAAKRSSRNPLYRGMIDMVEDKLFWMSALLLIVSLCIFAYVFYSWSANGFSSLGLQKETLCLVGIGITGISFVTQAITAHLLKRA